MSLYDNLKVAVLPLDIADAEIGLNLNAVADAMRQLPERTDVLVLPELFSTGYISDKDQAAALAQRNDGETISALTQLSSRYMTAICGSFLAKDSDGELFNRGFIIEPNGDKAFYDKRHLFCISRESEICQRGHRQIPIVRYRGWNIGLAVCYDLRFPVWLRNCDNKYDVLILPANWPDKRQYAWTQLLKARAIENEAYMVGANRSGEDEFGCYDGLSQIYDYMGKPIGISNGAFLVASLSRPSLHIYREHFPAWRDADTFTVKS